MGGSKEPVYGVTSSDDHFFRADDDTVTIPLPHGND